MPANGPDIVKRNECLKNERFNYDDRWEAMAPFIAPSRKGIITRFTPGEKQTQGVYDSTSMMAAELMAHFMAGHIINPAQQWATMKMRQPQFNEVDEVREWLEETRDRMLRRFASSSFYAEGPESLIDYGGFGTGALLTEEMPQPSNGVIQGFRGFFFKAQRTGRYVIAEGPSGLVDTLYSENQLTARSAKDQWGEDKLPGNVKKALAEQQMDRQFTFIHAIQPRAKVELGPGALGMPWMSAWVEKESKHLVKESGYRIFPWAVYRYHKTPGEVYGRGRGELAWPDTWTLNTAKRMGLEDLALKIKPPVLMAHDSVIGTLRLVPAGPTSVNTHGRPIKDVIMPYETGSHPEISMIKEEELRKSIRQIFFVEQILALMEIQKTEMTAFEFARKIELLFRLLGPVYGRLEWEWLMQMWDVAFDVMLEAGEFSPPPDVLFDSNGEIDVEFQNPIAKAQRVTDVEAITLALNDLAPMAQVYPEIWDGIDPDELRNFVAQTRGVPAKVLRNEQEIVAFRQARQERAEQDIALAQAREVADVAKGVAPIVKAVTGGQRDGAA